MPTTPPVAVAPQVSVIVPCWNAAASIGRALASVLEERTIPLECVVVDDGSTDGTPEVVRELAGRDPRVVLIESVANEGVSAARNHGLRRVRGEWLTFLDADDRLLPGGLAAMHRAAVASGALAVVGQRIWSDGVRTWITPHYDRPDIRVAGRRSLVRNPGLLFYASATGKLVHRSCREDLWFAGRVLGDQPWTIRALLRAGDRIEVIGDVVYEWTRPRPGNEFATITAAKHDSARLAAEAVRVAVGALDEVADEAERTIEDPADRSVIVIAYFDRLIQADFRGPVGRAALTGDGATVQLFAAIEAFLRAAPAEVTGRPGPALAALLWLPVVHWRHLGPEARAAALAMVAPIEAARAVHGTRGWPGMAVSLLVAIGAARRGRGRGVVDLALGLGSRAAGLGMAIRSRARRRG